ncbi:hypothetical protein D3C81_1643080 [compost metagenome]
MAGDQRRQEARAQIVRTMGIDGADRTAAQRGVHGPGMVGAEQHVVDRAGERPRQTLAAKFLRFFQGHPAVLGKLVVSGGEAGRGGDIAVLPVAAVLVTDPVERRQDLFGEACAFFENGVQRLAVHRLATLQLLVVARQVEQFMDDEAQVAHGGLVAGHAGIPDDWKNVWFLAVAGVRALPTRRWI